MSCKTCTLHTAPPAPVKNTIYYRLCADCQNTETKEEKCLEWIVKVIYSGEEPDLDCLCDEYAFEFNDVLATKFGKGWQLDDEISLVNNPTEAEMLNLNVDIELDLEKEFLSKLITVVGLPPQSIVNDEELSDG